MLMVMMVLLMTTATATFAVHSTMVEIRAAGHMRQALQTEYLAEGGLVGSMEYIDTLGGQVMYTAMRMPGSVRMIGTRLAPEEPMLDRAVYNFRVNMTDFHGSPGVEAPPVELEPTRTPSLGPHQPYVPRWHVDVNDDYQSFRADPGRRGDGYGVMQYLNVTYTSRGRMAPLDDFRAPDDLRDYHETAANARAWGEVGPIPR